MHLETRVRSSNEFRVIRVSFKLTEITMQQKSSASELKRCRNSWHQFTKKTTIGQKDRSLQSVKITMNS